MFAVEMELVVASLSGRQQQRAPKNGPRRVPASLRPRAAGALRDAVPVLCRWMCGRAIPQLAAI